MPPSSVAWLQLTLRGKGSNRTPVSLQTLERVPLGWRPLALFRPGGKFLSPPVLIIGGGPSSHSTSLVPVWEWDLSDPFAQLLVARVLSPGPLIGSVHADLCPGSVPTGGFGWDFVEPHSVNSSDPPLLGRSFSLSVPSRRVGEFLGSCCVLPLVCLFPPSP